ncbi:unnamed protein product [Cylicostephanus goldi]|uniref:Uncharacterized protein n=1 Tax=Cylicostephanus goldi TaxID=71465 RepID=A0A3P6TH10_CYLGO|nr:unnamed protein product [Cylicostephanus goldi]
MGNPEEAVAEKNLGNTAYKQKNFAEAHKHYDKAIELDPTNITFYTNKAVLFLMLYFRDVCCFKISGFLH